MQFFYRDFPTPQVTLYPLGDFHYGSRQCDVGFIKHVVKLIADDPNGYWFGMGDMMENAIIGSKSDVYLQVMPPKEQMEAIVELLKPIAKKGLFAIAGNHEQRSMRVVGLVPEQYICIQLGIPFMGYSCMGTIKLKSSHSPRTFSFYAHHNTGGGYTPGGKVNRAIALRKIAPTVDATFTGHVHMTGRNPVTWFEAGETQVLKKTGYDYIIGSTLTWNESYAEEKAKPASTVELIRVTFIGGTNGKHDSRRQIYEVIGKE
jgi:hypothetical protein